MAASLRAFFQLKLECDPAWQHLAVIFSDAMEPGEGEHKIMRLIRQQRTQVDLISLLWGWVACEW